MYKVIKFFVVLFFVFSSQANASALTMVDFNILNLTDEANGSLGASIVRNTSSVEMNISAYYYDEVTSAVTSAVVVGIDGVANRKHPAGIGVGKSAQSINPPGLDNVGGEVFADGFHAYLEFLVFSFDTNVRVIDIETQGLGPHGTSVEYWTGSSALGALSNIAQLGTKHTTFDTDPSFSPADADDVTWFAIGAKPEVDFNVFSIQSIKVVDVPSEVPVPAAFWLFLTGVLGLVRKKYVG